MPHKVEDSQKPTNAELTKRRNAVYRLLLTGASRADIHQYAAEKTDWEVHERTVDAYIAAATAKITEKADTVRDEEFGMAVERLRMLFRQNMGIQDYKAALQAQKELNELLGLYPDKAVKMSGDLVIRIERSDEAEE